MTSTIFPAACLLLLFLSSTLSTTAQSWTPRLNIGTTQAIELGLSFEAGSHIYVGGGIHSSSIFQYDAAANTWMARTNVPGGMMSYREGGVAFTLGGKAYVGLGVDFDPVTFTEIYLKDLWQYDPAANTWSRKADLPGSGRDAATAFVVGGKAYIAGGKVGAGYLGELWEYDPVADSWTRKANMPARTVYASAFGTASKGYIVFGQQQDSVSFVPAATSRLYAYDPSSDVWTEKTACPGPGRSSGIAVALHDTAIYAGTGQSGLTVFADMYRYNAATDQWTAAKAYPKARFGMAALVSGNRVFAGSGKTYQGSNTLYYDEWYELSQPGTAIETAAARKGSLICLPNPAFQTIRLRGIGDAAACRYVLYNGAGQMQSAGAIPGNGELGIGHLQPGIYYIEVTGRDGIVRTGSFTRLAG